MEKDQVQQMKEIRDQITRFMMTYKFGLREMDTKLTILKEEFQLFHDYNPIEHIKSRIKSPESILQKMLRKNIEMSLDSIKENIRDIVGIRIVCSFTADIYKISDMILKQKDITLIECKDYIKNPKSNGYKSLHLVLAIPVFMSDREEQVYVEIQIRTVAMDFWASLEHKIYYKYNKSIPEHLVKELTNAATAANELDLKMERLYKEVTYIKEQETSNYAVNPLGIGEGGFQIPDHFLDSLLKDRQ
ncbi:GTP pyrophosphokinase [Oceanobacillus arenosus]|uniref:GTP pyrophosphokinase n=1 Tax=Oceanobacillus arenosus TaxID=1229153 RepID=A0A3D8PGQ1_9BACI|nr:GTP pyrophosphokinase family protein [Oceanobacillus arenosus]RDW15264.1 GTP pyrophosphokinase [Oceanobacillus arenosus]